MRPFFLYLLLASQLTAFELRQIDFVATNRQTGAILARLPEGQIVQLEFSDSSDAKAVDALKRLLNVWYMSERSQNSNVRAFDVDLSFVVSYDEARAKRVPINYFPVYFAVVLKDWSIRLPFELSLVDAVEEGPLQGRCLSQSTMGVAFGALFSKEELRRHVRVDEHRVRSIEQTAENWRKQGMNTKMIATPELLEKLRQKEPNQLVEPTAARGVGSR